MYPSMLNMFQRKRLLSQPSSEDNSNFEDLVPQRETPFLEGLRQQLSNMPQREDYQPSLGRKLLSGLLGSLGSAATHNASYGVNLADQFTNAKYNRALSDFGTREKVLERGAALENQGLNRDINYAGRLGTFRHQVNTEAETKKYHDAMIENQLRDDARAETSGQNAQTNADRTYNENVRHHRETEGIQRTRLNKPPRPSKPPTELEINRKIASSLLRDYPEYGVYLGPNGLPKPPKATGDPAQDEKIMGDFFNFKNRYRFYADKVRGVNQISNKLAPTRSKTFPDLPVEEMNDEEPDEDVDDVDER